MRIPTRTIIRFAVAATVAVILLMPAVSSAVSWIPVVPCGTADNDICTPCDLFQTGKNVIDLVLFGITGPIAAFMIVLAGGMMLLGGGNPVMFQRGRTFLTRTLIGVGIILVSWTATNFLIKGLGGGTGNDAWYEFSCPAGLAAISEIDTQFVGGPAPLPIPAAVTPPAAVGIACPDRTLNLCADAAELNVTCKPCNDVLQILEEPALFGKNARGFISAEFLESIMINESSCAKNLKSPAGAYGPMQLLPSTANMFLSTCGVVEVDENGNQKETRVNGAWLMSEANWDKGVCLASAYLNSLIGKCGPDYRNLAAGYNGGSRACDASVSCQGLQSCGGGPMRVWECVWENRQHTRCNATRVGGGFSETRKYAPKVAACTQQL